MQIGLTDLKFTRVETELSFWGKPGYTPRPSAVRLAQQDISTALEVRPGNPDYLDVKAQILMWQAPRHDPGQFSVWPGSTAQPWSRAGHWRLVAFLARGYLSVERVI